MYYIYAHYTADTNELFYIGVGKGRRAKVSSNRNAYWKNIVAKRGISVEIFPQRYQCRITAVQREMTLQILLKPRACLHYGDSLYHTVRTEKSRAKQSAHMKGLFVGDKNANYGKPMSKSNKVKIGKANSKSVINCRGEIFNSAKEASLFLGIHEGAVSKSITGSHKHAGKYPDGTSILWKYIKKER